jgi:hypothetical protein
LSASCANRDTGLEKRANFDRLEGATSDVSFVVLIFHVREEFVSFFVSFPTRALNAPLAFIVSILLHASMDEYTLASSFGRDHGAMQSP